jgi:hypothetical protein
MASASYDTSAGDFVAGDDLAGFEGQRTGDTGA